jgi:plasmid stabilization system protein ParE
VKTRFAGPARQQAQRIDRWWRTNRSASKDLFARELADARKLIAATPDVGSPFSERQGLVVRRVLLPRTSHHVYYEIDRESDMVTIIAVWGTPRGQGPEL